MTRPRTIGDLTDHVRVAIDRVAAHLDHDEYVDLHLAADQLDLHAGRSIDLPHRHDRTPSDGN